MGIDFKPLAVTSDEPLRLELEDFFRAVSTRQAPKVTGEAGLAALEVACSILEKIAEHAEQVKRTLSSTGSS